MKMDHYAELYRSFRWLVPDTFNIAEACCLRWASTPAESRRIALFTEDDAGHRDIWTYGRLAESVQRLGNGLRRLGVGRGDRVAILMPQRAETAIAHLACHHIGAVSMPLSVQFGPEALEHRLINAEARVVIADGSALSALIEALRRCPSVEHVIGVDVQHEGLMSWKGLLARQETICPAAMTSASDPALLIYTSGTTGTPKGALIPHRALIGNLPGYVASQNWTPQDNDVFWTPADWAWTGGLLNGLLCTLYFGLPLVAWRPVGRFDPERSFDIMQRYRVTNTFLFPTALKLMMKAVPEPRQRYKLHLRAIMSAGESVGQTVFDWCESALGITPNEMFGQTEVNYIVGNSYQKWPARAGSIGRPYPGHRVSVIDDDGNEVPPGEVGEIAIHRADASGHPDPIFFLGYWRNEAATRAKFTGPWFRTGDLARSDAEGYLWYEGRADDVFKSSGYRIGPGEIENCLLQHPAVANAAVVPKPDAERGALVKAYVVLTSEQSRLGANESLIAQLQEHVRRRLAPYETPKEIEFIEQLPMTTTGKIQRRVLRLREEERARHSSSSSSR